MTLVMKEMTVEGFEKILHIQDKACGLEGYIAIHNTTLGPALGGIRFYPYASGQHALTDVMRLSKGMTHKAAIAGVGLGGGKSVVIMDPQKKSKAHLTSLAEAIDQLDGLYISAQDYGCTPADILFLKSQTRFVVGGLYDKGSGDPAPFTAWGVIAGIKATLLQLYNDDNFQDKVLAIQGLGSVGFKIAEHLFWLGCKLIVADIDEEKTKAAKDRFGAAIVSVEEIAFVECDIFCPSALGAILTPESIPLLNCKAVVGCANNQLASENDAFLLKKRGILYAPDFVVNAGGLINVSFEILKEGYNPRSAKKKIDQIEKTLAEIYQISNSRNITTQQAVSSMIEYRLEHKIGRREEEIYLAQSRKEVALV
jgi:leucine dehydrogenase